MTTACQHSSDGNWKLLAYITKNELWQLLVYIPQIQTDNCLPITKNKPVPNACLHTTERNNNCLPTYLRTKLWQLLSYTSLIWQKLTTACLHNKEWNCDNCFVYTLLTETDNCLPTYLRKNCDKCLSTLLRIKLWQLLTYTPLIRQKLTTACKTKNESVITVLCTHFWQKMTTAGL